ncbi:putrescine transporter subunit: membrane component of ABC superfamily [uncultured Alphaproteobacteria bacterium]|uniref:Putrescine transporter subunit: membrane component of ABC superfamily n=1 Tax=uncultured Alphaproteobacteria bacterium TaxID=91750 RepID=A0A212KMD8_9PROT|nr:putrescine transporter subunit: membrane component of ABC superfamily [uncultured Alphaproteobacteria bacterium]
MMPPPVHPAAPLSPPPGPSSPTLLGYLWRWLLGFPFVVRVRGLAMGTVSWGRALVTAVPFLWLLLFFGLPFLVVLKISFSQAVIAQPPYTPLLEWVDDGVMTLRLNFQNYLLLAQDSLYWMAYLNSLRIAAIATVCCLLIGYPMAYAISKARPEWRVPLLMLIILPFWTSFLIRVYAWIGILKNNGLLNNFLEWLGVIDQPLNLMHTDVSVLVGIVYSYLPFMVLPLYATLSRMDESLLEAAADLGCRPGRAFLTITLPLSMPGVIAGSMLVFIPTVGEFVIPDLLGGPDTLMIGKVLWTEFFSNKDWPVASAVAVATLLLLVVPIVRFQKAQEDGAKRVEEGRK